MTHSDYFLKLTCALACKDFDKFPEHDVEREAWTRRITLAAEGLANYIGKEYNIFDPEFQLS